MESSGWSSLDRKRNFQQMQSSHRREEQQAFATTNLPSPHPSEISNNHRPNNSNNNNINNNHHHRINLFHINNNTANHQDMAERMRNRGNRPLSRNSPYPPPRLQHRASQTVIDLTGDSDDHSSTTLQSRSAGSRADNQRPPRLGRNNILGANELEDLIDLTEDNSNQSDADLELVEVLQRRPALPHPNHHHHHQLQHHPRVHSNPRRGYDHRRPVNLPLPRQSEPEDRDSLFLPPGPNDPYNDRRNPLPRFPSFSRVSNIPNSLRNAAVNAVMANLPHHQGIMNFLGVGGGNIHAMHAMPPFNYDAVGLGLGESPGHQPPAASKTPFVPPPPAKKGYTRSPADLKEDEILVCPACEEELVQHESELPPPTTNSKGKALTDKERAEHPFWVVRKCGHVYCDRCYHDRKTKTGDAKFYVPGKPKTEKTLMCPVEDCSSAVGKPTDWIGVYM